MLTRHGLMACLARGTLASVALLATITSRAESLQSIPSLKLVRESVVDAASHDLSPIGWVAVGSNGTIAISQPQDHHIRFFSARGDSSGTFGRKGVGPGEFSSMTLHGWVGDTLWVADFDTRRFTLITPAGALVRSNMWPPGVRFPEGTARPLPSFIGTPPWALYPDGSVLLFAYPAGETVPAWMNRPPGTLVPFLRVSSDGLYRRVIAWTHTQDQACRVGTSERQFPKPLCFLPFWVISKKGGVVATVALERSDAQNDYVRAVVIKADGDTLLSHILSVPRQRVPRAVSDSIREQFLRAVNTSAPGGTVSFEMPGAFPPFVQGIVSLDERTIWLESGVATGDRVWHIFDLNGRELSTLRVPRAVQLQVVGLDRAWATERDPDGLESIVVLRVQR